MKKMILPLLVVLSTPAIAQINGTLTYENDYNEAGLKGRVITTFINRVSSTA
jgi:hypothetical protein